MRSLVRHSRRLTPDRLRLLACGAALLTAACQAPLAQRSAPYPAYGQDWDRQQADSASCEAWAQANAGSAGDAAAGGALGGAAVGALLGAGLGAIAGSFVGMADTGAAIGAAVGGASGGAQGAAGGAVAQDQRLVTAYRNCMAARGYVVNGAVPPPPTAPSPGATASATLPTANQPRTVETRLLALQKLHDDGLITDREYRDRRRAILADL